MGKLFGTDGVRGIANVELTVEMAMKIGKAVAATLKKDDFKKRKILIGKDTRLSSDMIESALIAGVCSLGVDVVCLGVIPTPAVAYLVKKYNASAGIMISASHNSFEFNGIKIFGENGYKLSDKIEEEIEKIVLEEKKINVSEVKDKDLGIKKNCEKAVDDYIEHLLRTIEGDLSGLKVVFDCSNGAVLHTAEKLFSKLKVNFVIKNNKPNGTNINANCGSVNIKNLSSYVKENKMDIGIAFDGDADRCLAVDECGNVIDGDTIMAICSKDLLQKNKLKKNTVVGTVMTNIGFNDFCKKNNLKFVSTKVGDRYVLEEILKNKYNFGGEQSGHIIFYDYATTGDGQLTAIQLLNIIKNSGKKLSELAKTLKKLPQIMINVNVSNSKKLKFYSDKEIKNEIEKISKEFEDKNNKILGRILVRVSGTEPLIRVMVEGENLERIKFLAEKVANLIKRKLS